MTDTLCHPSISNLVIFQNENMVYNNREIINFILIIYQIIFARSHTYI